MAQCELISVDIEWRGKQLLKMLFQWNYYAATLTIQD